MLALQHLTLTECGHGSADIGHDVVLCRCHAECHGAGKDKVAKDNCHVALPLSIHRGAATTLVSLVENIVVNERGGVYHLDKHCCKIGALRAVALVASLLTINAFARAHKRGAEHR